MRESRKGPTVDEERRDEREVEWRGQAEREEEKRGGERLMSVYQCECCRSFKLVFSNLDLP